MVKQKKPWLAAILNLVLNGLGYIYNGKRVTFGILILIASVGGLMLDSSSLAGLSSGTIGYILFAYAITSIAFAYDAYQDAKEINSGK